MKARTLRAYKTFKVWSNTFYIAPLALAAYWNLWGIVVLIIASIFFGTLYHITNEKRYYVPDALSAWLLIGANLVLCFLGAFQAPYFYIAVLFLALSLTYHFYLQSTGQYSINHGLWHLYGALITLFCIFTYSL